MRNFVKFLAIAAIAVVVGFSMISCDFFEEKECKHCEGTGQAHSTYLDAYYCTYTYNCADEFPKCAHCHGDGKL